MLDLRCDSYLPTSSIINVGISFVLTTKSPCFMVALIRDDHINYCNNQNPDVVIPFKYGHIVL